MASLELVRMDRNAIVYPHLRDRIGELLGTHNAADQEIQQVYDHIISSIL